jgi:adenosine deaminase
MAGLIYRRLFEDWETLDECLNGRPPSMGTLRRRLFVLERRTDPGRPDHFYQNYLDHRVGQEDNHAALLLKSLRDLATSHLAVRASRVVVHAEMFGEWQNLLPFISPLLVIVARLLEDGDSLTNIRTDQDAARRIRAADIRYTALPCVWDPALDDLIREQGLNEMHMHLNGSTELDKVWLAALTNPSGFFAEVRKADDKEMVRELYDQIRPGLSAYRVYRYLRIARRLKALLTRAAFGRGEEGAPVSMEEFTQAVRAVRTEGSDPPRWLEMGGRVFALVRPDLHRLGRTDLELEAIWLAGILRLLRRDPRPAHGALFHSYLLILGMVGRLTVQQVEQFGFDQFQKFTLNGLREDVERSYVDRFHQLSGPDQNDLGHFEGRFAPKTTNSRTASLVRDILRGFAQFHDPSPTGRAMFRTLTRNEMPISERRLQLSLVAHFIKERDKAIIDVVSRPEGQRRRRETYVRYEDLRQKFTHQGMGLLQLLTHVPAIRQYLTGIDGAANELHAPPEVFAPLFRMMRRGGVAHVCFHVGEDFEHLLSGIRAVWEAAEFLNLKSGDRIGHGTAVGIDPSLWKRRIGGERIMLRLQDHLDNLVFCHDKLTKLRPDLAAQIAYRIERVSDQLYRTVHSPRLLYDAWKLRRLDPLIAVHVHRAMERNEHFAGDRMLAERTLVHRQPDPHRRAETADALRAALDDRAAFRLFLNYHSADVHVRGMEWSEVMLDEIPVEALAELQHETIHELNSRNVAIETLPTSNVRISFYDCHDDHHVLRWLGLDRNVVTAAPQPTICVGSDDPGIFATNLRNEYAHLLQVLRRKVGLNTQEAITVLRQLNENGRAFRFRTNFRT